MALKKYLVLELFYRRPSSVNIFFFFSQGNHFPKPFIITKENACQRLTISTWRAAALSPLTFLIGWCFRRSSLIFKGSSQIKTPILGHLKLCRSSFLFKRKSFCYVVHFMSFSTVFGVRQADLHDFADFSDVNMETISHLEKHVRSLHICSNKDKIFLNPRLLNVE